jgi:hypothetical protein
MGTSEIRWKVEDRGSPAGRGLLRDHLARLEGPTLADAVAVLKMLEIHSHRLREPQSVPWGGGLFEIRRNEVRIFYVFQAGERIEVLKLLVGAAAPGVIAQLRRTQKQSCIRTQDTNPLSEWLEELVAQRTGLRKQVRRALTAMRLEHEQAMLAEIRWSASAVLPN